MSARNIGPGLDHMWLHLGSNQINSGRPRRARWGGGAGRPLQGLTADETAFFLDGQARFVFAPPGLRCRGQRLEVAELGQERVLVVVTTSGYDPPLFVEVADFAEGQ